MKTLNKIFNNFLKYFNNFLNIGLKDKDNIQEKKDVHLINFTFLIFFLHITSMGSINFLVKEYLISIQNLSTSILIIINFVIFSKIKNLKIASNTTTIILFISLMLNFINGGIKGTGILWFIFFPVAVIVFVGLKKGTIYFILSLIIQLYFKNQQWIFDYNKIYENFNSLFFRLILIQILLYITAYYFIKNRNEQYNEIDKINKQKTNLFINLAHETKTPLTLISNYLDKHIKKRGTSEELSVVKENLDKMINDMSNYLDIEKLGRGQFFYDHNCIINLSRIINIKVLLFKEIANKKRIKIKSDIPENVYIKIDSYAIDRIINNLLDNAIKYNKEKGQIKIRLNPLKDKVEFIIEDTGIGIDEEEIKYIFDPFYQSSKKKRNLYGIGMGLAILKKIIDEVNGVIEVSSKLNEGTIFKIIFNNYKLIEGDKVIEDVKYSNHRLAKTKRVLEEIKYTAERYNILVVEDNIEMLFFLQNNLKDKYNFYYALNGKEALEILKSIPRPNIIISDIMMDEMDGYAFLENINNSIEYKSIPFIFLTAKSFEEDRISGLKKGAIDFISKPFSIDILLNKIESIIKYQELNSDVVLKNIGEEIYNYLNIKSNSNTQVNGRENINYDIIGKLHSEYGITQKELDIINLLKKGLGYKEIGKDLNITINTVRTYIKRIFKKCDVRSTRELLNKLNIPEIY